MAARCFDVPTEEFLSLPDVWRALPTSSPGPAERSKFAAAVSSSGSLYICGGRSGRQALKDLWRFDSSAALWRRLEVGASSELPPLEGHSMVEHKGHLYVFGGTFGYPDSCETPLWIYSLEFQLCRQWFPHGEVSIPSSRRGHSAVVHRGAMFVFGGFVDLRGSVAELWSFDFDSECWHLAWSPSTHSEPGPSPRHNHSATVHDGAMWLYGGLCDLQPKNDFWKWSFRIGQWSRIRFSRGPSPMIHHTGSILYSQVENQLLIIGTNDTSCSSSTAAPPNISAWGFSFDFFCWRDLSDTIPSSSWGHFCAGQVLLFLSIPSHIPSACQAPSVPFLHPPPVSLMPPSSTFSSSSPSSVLPPSTASSCILEDIELCSEEELFSTNDQPQAEPQHPSEWAFRNHALSISSSSDVGDSGVDLRSPSQPSSASLRSGVSEDEKMRELDEAAAHLREIKVWRRQLVRLGCCRRRTPAQAMTIWLAELPPLRN